MAVMRMDHVGVVVEELDAAIAFFTELGLEMQGRMPVEGGWVDQVVGLAGVQVEIAMMRTPDGHSRLELTKFMSPAVVAGEPHPAPANTLGLRCFMFAVDDIRDAVFDDFVTMMEPIIFTLACASDLITSWNRHRKTAAQVAVT